MRPMWDQSKPIDRKWYPPDPSLEVPVVPYRHQARKLHPMQWFTYIIVIITCLAILYSLLNTYIFLNDLQVVLEQFGRSLRGAN